MSWATFRNLTASALAVLLAGFGLTAAPGSASAALLPVTGSEALAPGASPTTIYPATSNQPAAPVALSISNGFAKGDTITLQIEPDKSPNKTAAKSVSFASAPTVTVTGGTAGDTVPTFAATLKASATGLPNDELVITLGDTASGNPTDSSWTFTVSGISYDAGASAGGSGTVPVYLAASYTQSGSTAQALTGSPVANANLQDYRISETPTGVAEGSSSNPLADLTVTELLAGTVAQGQYTLAPAVASPSASAGSLVGNATVTATGLTVSAVPATGCPAAGGSSSVTIAANTSGQLQFCVVGVSSSAPGTLTVSGMHYTPAASPSATPAGPVDLALSTGSALSGNQVTYQAVQPAITVVFNPRVAGTTADDTAAAAAESLYPNGAMNSGQGGAVILASDSEYQDALSASFLGHAPLPYQNVLTSGAGTMSGPVPILLNPVNPPSQGESTTAAAAAIQKLGASTVYVVGGTYVISDAVVTALKAMKAGSSTTNLQVVRIAGVTAEETASMIATYQSWGTSLYSIPATPGAYGRYNSGASESASGPSSGTVATAILADANEFQDALSASPLAYAYSIPVLLNGGGAPLDPNAAAALTKLGVQQVIVVGGSSVISDQAVSDLESANISVLRIAGTTFDATAAELAGFELNDYTAPASGTTPVPEGLDGAATEAGGPTLTLGTSRGDAYQDALSASQVLGATKTTAVSPLLLNTDTSTLAGATGTLLGDYGTGPAGGLVIYDSTGAASVEHVSGDVVFGGTLAQTPSLVSSELDAIAAG